MTRLSRTQGFSTRYLAYLVYTTLIPGEGIRVCVHWRIGRWRIRFRHPIVMG